MPVSEAKSAASHFLNGREWRTFLTAVQSVVPYPKVAEAVKTGHAWFTDGAAKTSNWLLAGLNLRRP